MRTNLRSKTEIIALLVYLLYLIILTMVPFEFLIPSEVRYGLMEDTSISNFVLNIFLFIPFGFLFFSLIQNINRKGYIKVIICGVLGIILSFIIETFQLFLPRGPEILDIFTNTTGSIVGAILAKHYYNKVVGVIRYSWLRVQKSTYLLAIVIVLYSAAIFSLIVFTTQSVDFRNWNPSFTFQLGNEAHLLSPWVGKVYLVAIYNRDLLDKEVYTNFKAGPYSSNSTRIKDGLIAFYNFREGSGKTVHDSSGFGSPLNLTIHNPSKVRWLTPSGLEILGNTIVKSKGPAKKLHRAIKSTNKLTAEVWIAPGNIDQSGPARIVSFSKDGYHRNFTLCQQKDNIHFRVRTPRSGLNGVDIDLRTYDNFLTTEAQHLVATYRDGIETLFVNGTRNSSVSLFNDFLVLGFYGNNTLYKIAFCFFFFFPLNLLFYAFFSNHFGRAKTSALSAFLSLGLLGVIEVFYVLLLSPDFDFILLFIVASVSVFTTLFCSVYGKIGLSQKENLRLSYQSSKA